MSAPRIHLDRFPSFCKNYQNWWKFDEVLTKTNLLSFFGTRCNVHNCVQWCTSKIIGNPAYVGPKLIIHIYYLFR